MLWQQKTINAELLAKMFLAGAANLEAKKEFINELNVFPVPDGDTGTNMTLTIMSAAKEVQRHGETGYGISGKSDFFRFSSRSQRKLGSNPFSASERIYKDDPGRKRRSIRLYLHRHVSVQEQLLTRRS